jgi:hypothetical protein
MAGTNGQDSDPYTRRVLELMPRLRKAECQRLSAPRGSADRRAAEQTVEDLERALREAALSVLPSRRRD